MAAAEAPNAGHTVWDTKITDYASLFNAKAPHYCCTWTDEQMYLQNKIWVAYGTPGPGLGDEVPMHPSGNGMKIIPAVYAPMIGQQMVGWAHWSM
jgi:hypothetical protein